MISISISFELRLYFGGVGFIQKELSKMEG